MSITPDEVNQMTANHNKWEADKKFELLLHRNEGLHKKVKFLEARLDLLSQEALARRREWK